MPIHASNRPALDRHLREAEFSLRVATHFACLADTPALEDLQAALGKVGEARVWAKENLKVEPPILRAPRLPIGKGYPTTRKERLGHRWL